MQVSLETERLVLRPFTAADADNLFELDSDPAVMRFINGGHPTPRSESENEDLTWFIEYGQRFPGYGFWAVIERSTGSFLGWFLFRPPEDGRPDEPELGYRLRRPAWGKGYATEGSLALIEMGFTKLNVRRVVAFALVDNHASQRVMEKAGLSRERAFRHRWTDRFEGVEQEIVEYGLSKAEWKNLAG